MKIKKKYLIAGLVIVILGVFAIYFGLRSSGNSDERINNQKSIDNVEDKSKSNSGDNSESSDESDNSESSENHSNDKNLNSKTDSSLPSGNEWRSQVNGNNVIDISDLLVSVDDANQNKNSLSLPYQIPGSNLTLVNYTSYSGEYLEDGTNENVDNVAVIVIENNGSQGMDYCEITLTVNGKRLIFEGTGIAANTQVIMMAKDRAGFVSGPIEQCSAVVSEPINFEMSADKVELVSADDNGITIKNISKSTIPVIRIFYKYYDPEADGYIGGITYNYPVKDLKAGEETTVFPDHFAGTDSKVIMIRTYNSNE